MGRNDTLVVIQEVKVLHLRVRSGFRKIIGPQLYSSHIMRLRSTILFKSKSEIIQTLLTSKTETIHVVIDEKSSAEMRRIRNG